MYIHLKISLLKLMIAGAGRSEKLRLSGVIIRDSHLNLRSPGTPTKWDSPVYGPGKDSLLLYPAARCKEISSFIKVIVVLEKTLYMKRISFTSWKKR